MIELIGQTSWMLDRRLVIFRRLRANFEFRDLRNCTALVFR